MRMGRFVRGLVCTALCVCMTATTAFAQITPSAGKSGAAAAEAVNVEASSGDDDETIAELAAASTVKKLDASKIGLGDREDRVIISKAKNGIYFVNYTYDGKIKKMWCDVVFYNLSNNTYKTVYTKVMYTANDAYSDKMYCDDNGIYFLHNECLYEYDSWGYYTRVGYESYVESYSFVTGKTSRVNIPLSSENEPYRCEELGVDAEGRIYIYGKASFLSSQYYIYLFDKNGKYLSSAKIADGGLYHFSGFDATNGNFYYIGKDPDSPFKVCLKSGNVTSGKLTLKDANMVTMGTVGDYGSGQSVEMLNSKYLAVLLKNHGNQFMILNSTTVLPKNQGDKCVILNSNSYKYTDTVVNNSQSYASLNISDKKVSVMTLETAESSYGDTGNDVSSIGVRCDITADGSAIVAKTAAKTLTEYSISTKNQTVQHATKYPVYTFAMTNNNKCVAVEKSGSSYYVETIDWSRPTNFSVTSPASIKIGSTYNLKCSTSEEFVLGYTFKSSNSGVLSVDSTGKISAWKKGKAKITITAPTINKTKTVTVEVKDSALSKSSAYSVTAGVGATSDTIHRDNIDWLDNQTAYLTQLSNGYLQRVEYIRGKVVIETYDKSYNLTDVKTIKNPLPLWGGFFSGKTYNYLVFGQDNLNESDSKVVIRVVKYSKSWKKLGTCDVKGANTYKPFDAGVLDMAEAGDKLYIYTCHEMYAEYSEGYPIHHQANMIFRINQKTMKVIDSRYSVGGSSSVSHSFAQEIESDGKYIYTADSGDGSPRGIAFAKIKTSSKLVEFSDYSSESDVIRGTLHAVGGDWGSNYTGYNVSDMKLSTDAYVVTGIGQKSSKALTTEAKNVYVIASSKDELGTNIKWLTNYNSNSKNEVGSPKLVKLKGDQFLLMWEEKHKVKSKGGYVDYDYKYETKMVLLDEAGNKRSKIYSTTLALSLCDPILTKSGKVVWYVTDNSSPTFVEINPYKLASVQSKTKTDKTFDEDNPTGFDNSSSKRYRTGDMAVVKKRIYKLTSSSTVAFCGVVGSVPVTLTIGKTVKIGGKSYKITSIATRALQNRTKLKKLVIGGNVKTIGAKAFMGCTALASVSIGGNVTSIGDSSFYKCKALKKITIPAKVTKIGSKSFAGCKKLKTVSIKTKKLSKSKIGASAFKGIYSKATFKLPSSKVKSYKSILLKKGATKKMKFKKL